MNSPLRLYFGTNSFHLAPSCNCVFLSAGESLGRELQTLLWLLPVSNEEYASSIPLQQFCCHHTLWAYVEVNLYPHTRTQATKNHELADRHSHGRFSGRRTKINLFIFRYFSSCVCKLMVICPFGLWVDLYWVAGHTKMDFMWGFCYYNVVQYSRLRHTPTHKHTVWTMHAVSR